MRYLLSLYILLFFSISAIGGTLTGKTPQNTYKDLLHLNSSPENSGLTSTKVRVQDGQGTNLPFSASTTEVDFDANSLKVNSNKVVTGPSSATDNAITRFDGAGGNTTQNSGVTIDDSNNIAGAAGISGSTLSATSASITSYIDITTGSAPSTPSSSHGRIYGTNESGIFLPAFIDANGISQILQPALWNGEFAICLPNSGATMSNLGATFTLSGTASTPTISGSSKLGSIRRTRLDTSSVSGTPAGARTNAALVTRGNAAGVGGFHFFARFGLNADFNGAQAFVGLRLGGNLSGDPSAETDIIGIGFDSTDVPGNWFSMANDGSGTATKADLGANMARNTTSFYKLHIYAPPNDSNIYMSLYDEITGNTILNNQTFSSNLPQATAVLVPSVVIRNGSTASSIAIDVARIYCQNSF